MDKHGESVHFDDGKRAKDGGIAGFLRGLSDDLARSLRRGMASWNRAVGEIDGKQRRRSSIFGSTRRRRSMSKGRRARVPSSSSEVRKEEASLRKALELQKDLAALEVKQAAMEEQLVRARRHLMETERQLEALRSSGAEGAATLRASTAQQARAASHEIDLVYDSLRDLHLRATAVKRNPAFLRKEDSARLYEEVLAHRRRVEEKEEGEDFEADFRAGIARCGGTCKGVFLIADVSFCASCGAGVCQACVDSFGSRCPNCHARIYDNGQKRRRRKGKSGDVEERPKSFAGMDAEPEVPAEAARRLAGRPVPPTPPLPPRYETLRRQQQQRREQQQHQLLQQQQQKERRRKSKEHLVPLPLRRRSEDPDCDDDYKDPLYEYIK